MWPFNTWHRWTKQARRARLHRRFRRRRSPITSLSRQLCHAPTSSWRVSQCTVYATMLCPISVAPLSSSIGKVAGKPFMISSYCCWTYTAYSSGKSNPTSIERDDEFNQAFIMILSKPKKSMEISVIFEQDVLRIYRRNQVCCPYVFTCPPLLMSYTASWSHERPGSWDTHGNNGTSLHSVYRSGWSRPVRYHELLSFPKPTVKQVRWSKSSSERGRAPYILANTEIPDNASSLRIVCITGSTTTSFVSGL